jgi:hypothetical protein
MASEPLAHIVHRIGELGKPDFEWMRLLTGMAGTAV